EDAAQGFFDRWSDRPFLDEKPDLISVDLRNLEGCLQRTRFFDLESGGLLVADFEAETHPCRGGFFRFGVPSQRVAWTHRVFDDHRPRSGVFISESVCFGLTDFANLSQNALVDANARD